MNPEQYAQALRRGWKWIVSVALIGASVGFIWSSTRPDVYQSTATVFFQSSGAADVGALLQGSSFAQSQVRSYGELATKAVVLDPVITELGLPVNATKLAGSISVEVPLETVLVQVTASAGTATEAQELANAVASELGNTVESLSKTGTGKSAVPSVDAEVVQPGSLPQYRTSPSPRRDTVLAALLGALLGCVIAVTRWFVANRITNEAELASVTTAPLLARIPWVGGRKPSQQSLPSSNRAQTEAFRRAAANLDFVNHDGSVRSLVVTSANAGEGKSTFAANLAFTLSETRRVLLVDADLRNPTLASRLGLEPSIGLTTVITGESSMNDAIQRSGERLKVLTSGRIPPNPITLLGSDGFERFRTQAHADYDLVIFDAAPLLPVADSAVLAQGSDGAILVVSASKTSRRAFQRALEQLRLADVPTLGVAVTMTPLPKSETGYYGAHDESAATK